MKRICYILPGLIACMTLASLEAEAQAGVPRIVVNVTVDRLRTDYMQAFLPLYGQDGLRRLLREGRVYTRAEYPQSRLTRAASVATVATGTVPYNHGIVADRWLERSTLRSIACTDDPEYAGIQTEEKVSPRFLTVSTIGDELKVATEGKAIVYAIAPNADAAVTGAGHAANGAYWIDKVTGKWASTTYYAPQLPAWASVANQSVSPSEKADKAEWTPVSDLSGNFSYFPSGGMKKPFSYRFKGPHRFAQYLTSGLVNDAVSDFVSLCIRESSIGTDAITDYLSITYYAGSYEGQATYDHPIELQDTYTRLDRAIARLISEVETKVGKNNALFVLTSTGYSDDETANPEAYRIPTGTFDISRSASLLNMFLIALYGQGQYIEAYLGNELYLNHKLLEEKQLALNDVLQRSEELLMQMSGVKDVYTSQRLLLGAWTPGISRLRNSYNPSRSGDIMIEVAPGWHLINSDTHEEKLIRESYIPFPIIFYGGELKPETTETPVTTDCIAPTVAQVMRIRAPNACTSAALPGFTAWAKP